MGRINAYRRIGFAALGLTTLLLASPLYADDQTTPAKLLFGAVERPTGGPPISYGFYARGCMSGAVALPVTGPTWQVMRLSRNRFWGHPQTVHFVERLAALAPRAGWPGLLVGDMGSPRGGPMPSGHASHQIGLDVDIWFTPMPNGLLNQDERETMPPINLVKDRQHLNTATWTPNIGQLLRFASEDPVVARIFVNATIKRELCHIAGPDRTWLRKIRPWYGHDDHFHVRTICAAGSDGCEDQDPPPPGDGCDQSLDYWFTDAPYKKIVPPPPGSPPPREIMLSDLPRECTAVLHAQ